MGEDYYRVLEVGRDASQEEIRRAYRRLALKLHPDKNPQGKEAAEARFKAVSEAYEVLSDRTKRRQYNQFGSSAFNAQPQTDSPGSNLSGGAYAFTFREPEEVFREFFGAASGPFQDLFGRPGQPGRANKARGTTVLTGGLPFWPESFGPAEHSGFLYHEDDVLFATHVPGGMSVAPGFTGMPTQEMSSAWYEGGKRIETRTTIDESVKTVLRFEDGVPVSRAVNGLVQAVIENNEVVQGGAITTRKPSDIAAAPLGPGGAPVLGKRASQAKVARTAPPARAGSPRPSDAKPGFKPAPVRILNKIGKSRAHSKSAGGPKDASRSSKPAKKESADGAAGPSAPAAPPKGKPPK
ncbi:dnaJ homolog subfamily B member 6-B-like [Dermacentor albipictus]|uniref:dnaJ homolog subfamily B member 6-B-like n=1 Tax=Dermacentor albipictus TaxID=60249 RepID=UPI0031FDF35C